MLMTRQQVEVESTMFFMIAGLSPFMTVNFSAIRRFIVNRNVHSAWHFSSALARNPPVTPRLSGPLPA
jgi:hypothetical protein